MTIEEKIARLIDPEIWDDLDQSVVQHALPPDKRAEIISSVGRLCMSLEKAKKIRDLWREEMSKP